MVVEPATVEDAPATLLLHRTVLAEGRFFITEAREFAMTLEQRSGEIRGLNDAANSCFLVAREGRSILGFLTINGGRLARMAHTGKLVIMVDPRMRGQGVGRALMDAVIAWADAHPTLEKLGLAVFSDNEPAIALYRRYGFQGEGKRVREYRMIDGSYRDDLLMYRPCPPKHAN